MIKTYRHLYDRVELSSLDGQPMGVAWVIKKLDVPWYEHLLPKHRAFFNSLDPVQQLCCSMSCDPFQALRSLWVGRSRRS